MIQGAKDFIEHCGIAQDEKARRRINVSGAVANITAREIENEGVTLERLESIGVPVFRYSTQITIHGTLPDYTGGAVLGYKSITPNGNGTLGVKFCAIDAGKKKLLEDILSTVKTGWHLVRNSTDCELSRCCPEKETCVTTLKTIPTDLFYGSRYGVACPFGSGRYWACANIGAIPVENFWKIVATLGGPENEEEWIVIKTSRDKKRADERAAYEAQRKIERAKEEAKIAAFAATIPYNKISVLPSIPCDVRFLHTGYEGNKVLRYRLAKFGNDKAKVSLVDKEGNAIGKRRIDDLSLWQRRAERGMLYAV